MNENINKSHSKTQNFTCPSKCSFEYEKYRNYKIIIEKVVTTKKCFTIYDNLPALNVALEKRDWIRKYLPTQQTQLQKLPQRILLKEAKDRNDYEKIILSQMLLRSRPNFVWQPKHLENVEKCYDAYVNRIKISRNLDFTLKEGLHNCHNERHWHHIKNVAEMNCPRSYRLKHEDQHQEFFENFKLTACISLLQFINDIFDKGDFKTFFHSAGVLDEDIITFAIKHIEKFINFKMDNDIDQLRIKTDGSPQKWNEFLENYKNLIQNNRQFKCEKLNDDLIELVKKTIRTVTPYWPSMKLDGYRNIWILKPSNKSRGIGIQVMDDYSNIMNFVKGHPQMCYMIQKYIERPLIIHNTKFDIRQYFMLTYTKSLEIWMYKTCYFKFSGQPFDLTNFHSSIHLTNHAVQKNFTNNVARSDKIPSHNMWSLEEFQKYLIEIKSENAWNEKIYKGMTKNIIGTIYAALDDMSFDRNTFQLYGCDFMLSENYDPILIEINSTPDLTRSTPVTAIICPAVMEDLVKVIIDHYHDQNNSASTGNFELVHTIDIPHVSSYNYDLQVCGRNISSGKNARKSQTMKKSMNIVNPMCRPIHLGNTKIKKAQSEINKFDKIYKKDDNDILTKMSKIVESVTTLSNNLKQNEMMVKNQNYLKINT